MELSGTIPTGNTWEAGKEAGKVEVGFPGEATEHFWSKARLTHCPVRDGVGYFSSGGQEEEGCGVVES